MSQKSGPFAPPALPGINAPTTLSDSRLGISENLADVYIFRFDRDSLIFCTRLLPAVRAGGFATLRDCDFGAFLRGLAAFASTRLVAAFFATFADFLDVLLAIAFTRRCLRYATVATAACREC